jgi:hypothetical protein
MLSLTSINLRESGMKYIFVPDLLALMILVKLSSWTKMGTALSVGLSFKNDEQNLWVACKTFTMMNKVMVFRKS